MTAARRFAITGSTGTLGEALTDHLRSRGDQVLRVVRDRSAGMGHDIYWSPGDGEIDAAAFEGLDGVVHLAGSPIGPRLWTDGVKRQIMKSRSRGTGLLATTLAALDDPPPVLISQSAIGWYGRDRGDELLTETSDGPGDDFLAEVCEVWEHSTGAAQEDDRIRVCITRTGLVLSSDGGLLPLMALPFRVGVGGPLGSGEQWMSWISIEDQVRAWAFLLDQPDVSGVFNLVGPAPVRNEEFSRALADILSRPSWLRVPRIVPPGNLGQMLELTAFASQRVIPSALERAGFEFRHEDVRSALRAVL
ncbi:MAG: TIGR01777 family oxidoreductase [Nitriliruptorales bacterium]|nr:TIGR01777 family oxidoreductase [Nitriliruptorales bacterium]